jgi:hypothetical protein
LSAFAFTADIEADRRFAELLNRDDVLQRILAKQNGIESVGDYRLPRVTSS